MSKVMDDRRSSNSSHRLRWTQLLSRLLTPSFWESLGEGQAVDGNRSRAGWTVKYLVLMSCCMGWSRRRQQTKRFSEARDIASALFPGDRPLPRSYQGFFKQLHCAGIGLLHSAMVEFRARIPRYVGTQWFVDNWIPLGVDGSRIDAPRSVRNEAAMGRAGRSKSGPQLWVTVLSHLPTGLLWDWRQGPGTASERAHLLDMIDTLPDRAITVADAGYMGYEVMHAMNQAGQAFLIRCAGNATLLLQNQQVPIKLQHARQNARVYLWPERIYKQGRKPLVLRLIVLRKQNQSVYLLTNILAPTALPKRMASEFYTARWGVEMTFRGMKQTMSRRKLLSKSPEHAELELAANVLALFLLVLQSILVLKKRCASLSLSCALEAVQTAMQGLCWGVEWEDFGACLASALRDSYKRNGTKRARDWPHKKRDKPPGPPQFRRLSQKQRLRIQSLRPQLSETG